MSFSLTPEPIGETPAASSDRDGAVATFIGRVRNHNEGQPVSALEYEVYGELALSEGARIIEEANERFAITSAQCVHRVGLLKIGDAAIRVDVAAPHRKAAFEACRYIVDETKRKVPIWKKEHYVGGESEWINCAEPARSTSYYERQTRLPEVGEVGQERLASASVLVVGAGGLGSSALQYLAAAGVGNLGIVEYDRLEESNLHRQTLYSHGEVGQQKAQLASERMRSLNPFIQVRSHDEPVNTRTAERLIKDYDIVLDCTDNFQAKFLLNDVCVKAEKTLLQASIHQYEGHLLAVVPSGPCLRCLWPETPEEGCVGSCAEAGVLGFVPGVFGTLQAAEAIKLILCMPSPLVHGNMLVLNLLDYSTQLLSLPRTANCPGCGGGALKVEDSSLRVEELNGEVVIDIRDADEVAAAPLAVTCLHVPVEALQGFDWREDKRYVLVCTKGARSSRAVRELRSQGISNVYSLVGGLGALRRSSAASSNADDGDVV